jgi:hypothetical protein
MLQHRELNDRFKAYQRRSRALRIGTISLLCVCLKVGIGLAFENAVPPNSVARAVLRNLFASTWSNFSDALSNFPSRAPVFSKPSVASSQLRSLTLQTT